MRPPLPGRVSAQRGSSTLLFTLLMLFSIATLALGTDVARLLVERARLEQAAAATARSVLAVAIDDQGTLNPEVATAHARAFAPALISAHAGASRSPVARVAELVFERPDAFTVTLRQPLAPDGSPVVCASRLLGVRRLELTASATARARPRVTGAREAAAGAPAVASSPSR